MDDATCTSKVKYFFKFFIIMTRKGSLIPSVFLGSAGHVMYVVLSKTKMGASKFVYAVVTRAVYRNQPHVCTHNFQYQRLDIVVCYPLNVTVANLVAMMGTLAPCHT